MKKATLLLTIIGLITMSMTLRSSFSGEKEPGKYEQPNEKYNQCIEACEECIVTCKDFEEHYTDAKNPDLVPALVLCRETIASCEMTSKLLTFNTESVYEACTKSAQACETFAAECNKSSAKRYKACSKICHKTARLCRGIADDE